MGKSPRVSIGVPVHNGAATLAGALDDLLNQTFRDTEIIISDNASTDGTAEICHTYAAKDDRIRYIRQPALVPAADNFVLVLAQARGAFFMWAADDDRHSPNFVERLFEALEAAPRAVLAFGDVLEVTDAGSRSVRFDFTNVGFSLRERLRSAAFLQCYHIYGLWRTDAIRRIRWAPNDPWADTPVMMAASILGDFIHVPGVTFRYYQQYRRYFRWARRPGVSGALRDVGLFLRRITHLGLLVWQSARTVANVSDPGRGLLAGWYSFVKVMRQVARSLWPLDHECDEKRR